MIARDEPCRTGGCLCGAVRFELAEPARLAGHCHCTRCARRTGNGFSTQARVDGIGFTVTAGEEHVAGWVAADGGMEKCFCRLCGAHLFSRHAQTGAVGSVRMGAFDSDPGVRPSFHTFTDDAPDWAPVPDDGLTRFAEGRPRGG